MTDSDGGPASATTGLDLDELFQRSLLPMLLTDDARRYTDANASACLLLGRPRAEILGRRVEDFTPGAASDEIESRWRQFLSEGVQAGSWQLSGRNGQLIQVDYSATANVAPGRHLTILIPAELFYDGSRDQVEDGHGEVSPREREVLSLLVLGLTGKQIAAELSLSLETVQKHVQSAKHKLGATTRAHAVALALQRGVIDARSR